MYQKAKNELNPNILKTLRDNGFLKSTELILLSNIELKSNNIELAKDYANQSLVYAESNHDIIHSYTILKDIALKQHDYKASIGYSDSTKIYTEKLYDLKLLEKTKELEKGFYLKQKDLRIKELEFRNKVASQRNKFIAIISFSLLALFGVFYYLYSKNRQLQSENNKNLLEQKLFASQMSPHFIFNALSAIQAEVLKNNVKEANTYLIKFGKLLQNILINTNQEFVSISSEFNNLIHYVDLQRIRYRNFEYELNTYEGITDDEDEIPPMLLQPLVENAIEHGLKTQENGLLKIVIKKIDSILQCQIIDNGMGLNSNSKSNNISTSLIRKRLKYLAIKKHKVLYLKIENNPKQGVTSTITIPYQTKF